MKALVFWKERAIAKPRPSFGTSPLTRRRWRYLNFLHSAPNKLSEGRSPQGSVSVRKLLADLSLNVGVVPDRAAEAEMV
jgi:hypothetical protein